jgi:putative ABC transport system permease protein
MSFLRRVINLGRSNRVQREIDREMSFHIEERVEELVATGMPRALADSMARKQFGNRTIQVEDTRRTDMLGWADSFLGDLRYALRGLRRSPVFTMVAVASLAIGIGFNTSIYSLIDAVMLRPLPVPAPQQLVQVVTGDAENASGYFTNPLWEQLRDNATGFHGLAAFSETEFNLANAGEARPVPAVWVSGDYFRVFGMQPAVGRLLTPEDDQRGCTGVAVLSHSFWQTEFGGRPDIVGTTMPIGGKPFEIVGTLPAGHFRGPEVGREPMLYTPLCANAYLPGFGNNLDGRSNWWIRVIGRHDPLLSLEQVRARVKSLASNAYANTIPPLWSEARKADYVKRTFSVRSVEHGLSGLRDRYSKALLVLMGTVAILLLIACANIANLLLARATTREREVAIRMAIGAGRRRLVRQLLTESALLAIIGAAAGLLVARWGTDALVALITSPTSPVSLDLSLNLRVLGFTAAAAIFTAIVFGLIPAWRGTRIDPQVAMKAGGRGVVEGVARGRFTMAKSLVVVQVALSMVLLVGAGLLVGSLRNLRTLDAGFNPAGVLLVSADMRRASWPESERGAMRKQLLERVRGLPGVQAASSADVTPIGGSSWNNQIFVDGFTAKSEQDGLVWFNEVSDGYFAAMDIRMLSGRDFGPTDVPTSPKVAIIDELTAKKFFGAGSPIGKQYRTKSGDTFEEPFTVIGVVESAKYRSLRETDSETIYQAAAQVAKPGAYTTLQVRTLGDPLALVPAVRAMLAEFAPSATVKFSTLANTLDRSLARERMLAVLSAAFGAVALSLSVLGLYGVMSYAVARRRNEIGVRIALGAERGRVLGMVLGDVARVVAIGVVMGAAGALAAGKLVQSFLFGLSPMEPVVLALAVGTLLAVAIAAGLVPAWRASRVDPAVALRDE